MGSTTCGGFTFSAGFVSGGAWVAVAAADSSLSVAPCCFVVALPPPDACAADCGFAASFGTQIRPSHFWQNAYWPAAVSGKFSGALQRGQVSVIGMQVLLEFRKRNRCAVWIEESTNADPTFTILTRNPNCREPRAAYA
jgi:hypothetical protein